MKIENRPLDSISPYPGNPRKNAAAVDPVARSIAEFGFNQPLVVDGDGVIVVGHVRYQAAIQLGLETVPVYVAAEMSEAQARAYRLADNRTAEYATWDDKLLPLEIEALAAGGFDMPATGFLQAELAALINDAGGSSGEDDVEAIDRAAELLKQWKTKPGQLWRIEGQQSHRLLCGDATKAEDVERVMGGEKADMVYADPPYGINLETNYHKRYGHEKSSRGAELYGDDEGIDLAALLAVFDGVKDIFVWGAENYPDALPRGGSWVVWDKSVESVDGIASDFELCWSKQRHHYSIIRKLWKGVKAREESGEESQKTRWPHPTQKPIDVARWFFDRWGKGKGVTVDPFLGSGTTMVAAEQLNRRCYGIEISPAYCAVILERMTAAGCKCSLDQPAAAPKQKPAKQRRPKKKPAKKTTKRRQAK